MDATVQETAPAEEKAAEEAPAEEKTTDEVPAEAPAEEKPAEEAPAEAPAEEKPAEEAPAEAPAEEKPAEEVPAEVPAEEKPAEETPAEDKPVEEVETTEAEVGNLVCVYLLTITLLYLIHLTGSGTYYLIVLVEKKNYADLIFHALFSVSLFSSSSVLNSYNILNTNLHLIYLTVPCWCISSMLFFFWLKIIHDFITICGTI